MRTTLLLMLLAIFATSMTLGCTTAAPATEQPSDTEGSRAFVEETLAPDWYLNPPREPGMAFYGVGLADQVRNLALAKQAADDRARRDIAGTLQTKIAAILKSYMRSVLGPDMPDGAEEEQFVQDTMMAIIDGVNINGAEIVKRDMGRRNADGSYPAYSLARIGFDSVADSLYNETRDSVQRVKANAEVAFDELRDLLASDKPPAAAEEPEASGD